MPILLFLFVLVAMPVFAQMANSGGLIFSREKIFIETEVTLPPDAAETPDTQGPVKDASQVPRLEARRYFFDTEIRTHDALKLEWFHSLANVQSGRAIMIVFKETGPQSLPLAKLYKPIDVLVIAEDGEVLAILPNIILASQSKQIDMDMPVKAFLFIKADDASALQIKPKNHVLHPIFTRDPTVLQ